MTMQTATVSEVQPLSRIHQGPIAAKIGELWYRVEGSYIGDEVYEGMELLWTTWRCVKTTRKGAWFQCETWSHLKPRFALTSGSRAISPTKSDALERLVARKVRHLRILSAQTTAAEDTLKAAREALSKGKISPKASH